MKYRSDGWIGDACENMRKRDIQAKMVIGMAEGVVCFKTRGDVDAEAARKMLAACYAILRTEQGAGG